MQYLFKKIISTASQKGQSLVEMAIIAPLLIFILIGVFEVGWAIRGYLVLANVNREVARFAVRPGYLNYATNDDVITSTQRVRDWVATSASGQLGMDFDDSTGNATLYITHLVVDTGLPCEDIVANPTGCDCNKFDPNHADYDPGHSNIFERDDLILSP